MYNKEIEFKNLLTLEEYNKIYDHYNLSKAREITNENYYYDTKDNTLKKNNVALRIRKNELLEEMTLKIKKDKGNIEINEKFEITTPKKLLTLSDMPKNIKTYIEKNALGKDFYLTQKIITKRKELQISEGLIVLDKTYFLNDVVDYELEFEVCDYEKGKNYFYSLLDKLGIQKKEAQPKIARAFEYTNK